MRLRFLSVSALNDAELSLSVGEKWNKVSRLLNWKKDDYIIFTDGSACLAVAQVSKAASVTSDPIFTNRKYESRIPLKLCVDYGVRKSSHLTDVWNLLEDKKSLRKSWPHKRPRFWNMRLIDGVYADCIFDRLCEKKEKPVDSVENVSENNVLSSDYESQNLIKWFWGSTGLRYQDKGFCRHNLPTLGGDVTERLLAFTVLGVFLDQVVYTHFRNNFSHSSGFQHHESVYDRFSKLFRLPKYYSCSASGAIGSMVPAIALLELLNRVDEDVFYSEIDKLGKLLLSDIYTWFKVNVGQRPQFVLHNYLLAEIIIEIGSCNKLDKHRAENIISCLLKAGAEFADAEDT